MSTNFTTKFANAIVSTLGCHDRVIFKGHLPFGRDHHLNGWVDHGLKMRRKDFLPFVEKQSQALVDHARAEADKAGVPFQRLAGKPKKEPLVQELLRQSPRSEGLISVLQVMETCRTVKLLHGRERVGAAGRRRAGADSYYYFLDPQFAGRTPTDRTRILTKECSLRIWAGRTGLGAGPDHRRIAATGKPYQPEKTAYLDFTRRYGTVQLEAEPCVSGSG